MKAIINGPDARCPRCGKLLCRVSHGAVADGVTLWCKGCKDSVQLIINN